MERPELSLSFMLQLNEGHFPSAGGMVCGIQIGLVEAVGSVNHDFEGPRVTETFHPSFIHTASWHCYSAFSCDRITPHIGSNGCFMFDHCTNVRSVLSVAGSRAELADHVLSAKVPVGTLGTATVQGLQRY